MSNKTVQAEPNKDRVRETFYGESDFEKFREALTKRFAALEEKYNVCFMVDINQDINLADLYLESIPEEINYIYRKCRVYDCNACKHFIKQAGRVVFINKNFQKESIWRNLDIEDDNYFKSVAEKMADVVEAGNITSVGFFQDFDIGTEFSFEYDEENKKSIQHYHLHHRLKDESALNFHIYRNKSNAKNYSTPFTESTELAQAEIRDRKSVFLRMMEEFNVDMLHETIELIEAKQFYRGNDHHVEMINQLIAYLDQYNKLTNIETKNNFGWMVAFKETDELCKLRNTSIGTFLTDICTGVSFEDAYQSYLKKVDPMNYKRIKTLYSKRDLEEGKKALINEGYIDSLERRFANIEDISINDVIWVNMYSSKKMKNSTNNAVIDNIFSNMDYRLPDVDVSKIDKLNCRRINIQDFIRDIVPNANNIQILFDSTLKKNLVSLIAPKNPDSKSLFKWDNSFSWSYSGNITDSIIKEEVKKSGGITDSFLRFSIMWNDTITFDDSDLDAHCIINPYDIKNYRSEEIMFSNKRSRATSGFLDIDITHPKKDERAVENIAFTDEGKMIDGTYSFFVHQYFNRGNSCGFKAEIEMPDGNIYTYEYNKGIDTKNKVLVADVDIKDGVCTIKHHLDPVGCKTETEWNISTNKFIEVNVITLSPNYWGDNHVGNKHYFFMLDGCISDESPNAFYNEFIKDELVNKHRKFINALGNQLKIESCEEQLSGLGFCDTMSKEFFVRVNDRNTSKTTLYKVLI